MNKAINTGTTDVRKATALTADEIGMLTAATETVNIEIDTALGLLHLMHTSTALDADGYVLVNAIEGAVRKIGLINQRMNNVVHPGNLDAADATDWLNLRDAWGIAPTSQQAQEGGAA